MKLLTSLTLLCALCAAGVAAAAPAKPARHGASKATPKKPAPVKRPTIDYAGEQVNFLEWQAVRAFIDDVALRQGFPREELEALFRQIRYVDSAVQLVKPPPVGKPKNMNAVRALMIEPVRINAGIRFWNEHAETLARAEKEFGVPAEIIVGILGVETVYGRNTGRFRVLDVLTTLAFAYPEAPNQAARMAFFRGELENTLLLARKNALDPFTLLGSFAGAIGMPQFMPGSVLAYGVDYDNDGNLDLRNSAVDAIGSIAHFLQQHGWQANQTGPLVYLAHVAPEREWERFVGQGLAAKFTLQEITAAGVASANRPPPERLYSLIDLQNGADATEYWLASDNFFAITQYNRSYFYAMSVIEVGRAVKHNRDAAAVIPRETL
ncbi:lytic murein transglycosylase B [Massilia sp. CF038]|uniref:lytic murein transglycosylase B n=1 Tax=Massilia sp. CF038 TaxID=1881045 RepID=UPI000917DEBA|nr:lytic murein transglycosylase B [Massilia sp. CF038]SHH15625.1 membrane-bound lytic murein transglycosylase B [Massilia sp. CF038]